MIAAIATIVCLVCVEAKAAELVAHWPLNTDASDVSTAEHLGQAHHLKFSRSVAPDAAATFDGRQSYIEVDDAPDFNFGASEFSVSLWAYTEARLDDVLGDLIGKFDPSTRTGFNLSIQNNAGVVSAQSNYRHLHFGIDEGRVDPTWTDCGRPGNNLFVFALCVYDGNLYAGTFEHGNDEAGHVYRYGGGQQWIDCGTPARCNAVQALAVFDGQLYAGVGRYLSRGSALPESPNEIPGGRVLRYEGPGKWVECGQLQNPETGAAFTVGGMAVFRGALYAGVSKPAGRGLYRYTGGQTWDYLGNPGHRVTNPVVYNGDLYFCSLDGGGITRFSDGKWTDVGKPAGVSQTYGFAVYRGGLYASSWPNGEVFHYQGNQSWVSDGRLGSEKEVMGMAVYNGKLYGGTLPLAEVYRFDGDRRWVSTGQLDQTPNVKYRRAWSMAVFDGKLYCGTLPSGHVFSLEAGRNVTHDRALPPGWVHLAAVRGHDQLRLYVNGKLAAESARFASEDYNISNHQPLKIGLGEHDFFKGKMRDVRVFRGSLTNEEVAELARQ